MYLIHICIRSEHLRRPMQCTEVLKTHTQVSGTPRVPNVSQKYKLYTCLKSYEDNARFHAANLWSLVRVFAVAVTARILTGPRAPLISRRPASAQLVYVRL